MTNKGSLTRTEDNPIDSVTEIYNIIKSYIDNGNLVIFFGYGYVLDNNGNPTSTKRKHFAIINGYEEGFIVGTIGDSHYLIIYIEDPVDSSRTLITDYMQIYPHITGLYMFGKK